MDRREYTRIKRRKVGIGLGEAIVCLIVGMIIIAVLFAAFKVSVSNVPLPLTVIVCIMMWMAVCSVWLGVKERVK